MWNPGARDLGIGIDTGGTFTDIVLIDLALEDILRKAKTPTTHGDYTVCIRNAFQALNLARDEAGRLRRVALSTTLATNTVAEGRVHPTALVIEPGDIALPADFHPYLALLRSEVGFDAVELAPVSEAEVVSVAAVHQGAFREWRTRYSKRKKSRRRSPTIWAKT